MNYTKARLYINECSKYGISMGLESVGKLCAALGNPQDKIDVIHIAGTNGKGSVGAFIESILNAAGIKAGRFSSPAVFDYLEQFRISGEDISEEMYARYMSRVIDAADKISPHPTPFEMETAAAYLCFAEEHCSVAVIEAGMGGSLDATNIISKSLVSVFTHIAIDHARFLGSSLSEIAKEKAGIIKPNATVVSAAQSNEAASVIEKACREKNAELTVCGRETEYEISLRGSYQQENAAVAAEVCRKIDGVSEDDIKTGLKNTVWRGRFEKICDNPIFIIDGAHNPDGAARFVESLDLYYPDKKVIYIMGVLADKDYEEIAKITSLRAEYIYTITPEVKRGLDNEILAQTVKKYNKNVSAVSMETAICESLKKKDAIIAAFGSLSFLGALEDKMRQIMLEEKCARILKNKKFLDTLSKIGEAEKGRIYCRHGIEHLMDVARAGYIISLENGLDIPKWLIYAAALVHDIGRYEQYANGADHHEAGGKIAAQILSECGFSSDETESIVRALSRHSETDVQIKTLDGVIAAADKKTRMCMLCGASDTCKWKDEDKNLDLTI